MHLSLGKRGQSLMLLYLLLLIVIGTGFFMLPGIRSNGGQLAWYDALFMATSSVCVTGLSVADVSGFSSLGQFLILVLVEIGGLGIMTLSVSILLALGKGLSFNDSLMISSRSENFFLRSSERFSLGIVLYALVCELFGFLFLLAGLEVNSFGERLWDSFFLAVTGFCNAGFTPFAKGLAVQGRYIQTVIAFLVILGGLGVYVICDLLQMLRNGNLRMRLHSKVVLYMTFFLLIGGAVLLWLLGNWEGQSLSVFDSWFFSVNARTSGFSTISPGMLSPSCLTLLMILMLIGGSPGSTAGGMKTSTVALALSALFSTFQGNSEVLLCHRAIPSQHVLRAFSIIVLFLLLTGSGTLVFQVLSSELPHGHGLFYVISALTTTGFAPDNLLAMQPPRAKLFLALLMFIGRVGPFSLMLFFFSREKSGHIRHPEERLIIG